jgi:hypothetical protein
VDVAVPGVSDMLKLFGVPTLFLLPGVLVLGAMALVRPPPEKSQMFAFLRPGFWIVAISLSLLISRVYLWLRGDGAWRDGLERFDLADVGWLWAGSILLGALLGLAWRARDRADAKAAAASQNARTIGAGDTPEGLLAKLDRVGAPWPLRFCRIDGQEGFLHEQDGRIWLVPQARPVHWLNAQNSQPERLAAHDVLKTLEDEKATPRDILAKLSEPGMDALGGLTWVENRKPARLGEDAKPDTLAGRFFIKRAP